MKTYRDSKWFKQIIANSDGYGLDDQKIIRQILRSKLPVDVWLFRNDERSPADMYQWAIVVDGTEDYWIDAMPTRKEAREFCKEHGLRIVKEIK